MNIKRFFAKSSREALNQVRQALGGDAVILSNRAVEGGTEILAVKEHDMDQMISVGEGQTTPLSAQAQQQIDLLTKKNRVAAEPIPEPSTEPAAMLGLAHAPSSVSAQHTLGVETIMHELKSMRYLLQSQLTELSWNNIQQRDPLKSELLTALLSAGFSAMLSRHIAEKSPAFQNRAEAVLWLKQVLANNISSIPDETELLTQGGVFALIGPTGVGKTTTTAKLAARYVMKHGPNKLALITTDAYRIGGHEQLRIYGKILGVMVHAVKDQSDLKLALQELKNKHTILIDTVGVSQRDNMVTEQIAMLHGAGTDIKKILCLNATCTGETLTDVMRAYKGRGLEGAIITKLDEAATIGSVLDIVIREKLKLHYVANGQRVPEDLHLANKQLLLHHALKLSQKKQGAFGFNSSELPFLMANAEVMANPGLAGSTAQTSSQMGMEFSHE